jgi:hypothetical protein
LREKVMRGSFEKLLQSDPYGGVSQAYLLVGIAKPTATANLIFDTLLADCLSLSRESEVSSISKMSDHSKDNNLALVYSSIKNSWEAKLSSFEYFKFMVRIYCQLSEQQLSHDEICD